MYATVKPYNCTEIKINISILVSLTHHQFRENHHGDPKGAFSCYFFKISLLLTLKINRQGLIVGEQGVHDSISKNSL